MTAAVTGSPTGSTSRATSARRSPSGWPDRAGRAARSRSAMPTTTATSTSTGSRPTSRRDQPQRCAVHQRPPDLHAQSVPPAPGNGDEVRAIHPTAATRPTSSSSTAPTRPGRSRSSSWFRRARSTARPRSFSLLRSVRTSLRLRRVWLQRPRRAGRGDLLDLRRQPGRPGPRRSTLRQAGTYVVTARVTDDGGATVVVQPDRDGGRYAGRDGIDFRGATGPRRRAVGDLAYPAGVQAGDAALLVVTSNAACPRSLRTHGLVLVRASSTVDGDDCVVADDPDRGSGSVTASATVAGC